MKKKFALLLMFLAAAVSASEIKVVFFPCREAVISARVESVLQEYPFKAGELFKQESIICRLDNARYGLDLKKSTGHRDFARVTYEDKKQLRAQNLTSDYELRKAAYDLEMATHAVEDAKLNFSFCAIKAPFSGKIVEIITRPHEICRPGQPLLRIIDDNELLAVANVPLKNRSLTTAGNSVTLTVEGKGVVKGTIREVFPQADHRTGTVKIHILVPNTSKALTPGMTGVLNHGQ